MVQRLDYLRAILDEQELTARMNAIIIMMHVMLHRPPPAAAGPALFDLRGRAGAKQPFPDNCLRGRLRFGGHASPLAAKRWGQRGGRRRPNCSPLQRTRIHVGYTTSWEARELRSRQPHPMFTPSIRKEASPVSADAVRWSCACGRDNGRAHGCCGLWTG